MLLDFFGLQDEISAFHTLPVRPPLPRAGQGCMRVRKQFCKFWVLSCEIPMFIAPNDEFRQPAEKHSMGLFECRPGTHSRLWHDVSLPARA